MRPTTRAESLALRDEIARTKARKTRRQRYATKKAHHDLMAELTKQATRRSK